MGIQPFEEVLTSQQVKDKIKELESKLYRTKPGCEQGRYLIRKIAALLIQLDDLEQTIPQHDNEDWLAIQESYELHHK